MSVYFVTTPDPVGPVKIGYAANVMARLRALQTGCAEPLVLTLVIAGAGRDVDDELHAKSAADRIRSSGEWFRRSPAMVDFVEAARSAPRTVIAGAPPSERFPWGRAIVAVVLFVASIAIFGPIGVAIGIGLTVGLFMPPSPTFGLAFLGD